MKKIFIRPTLCCNPTPLDTTPIDDMMDVLIMTDDKIQIDYDPLGHNRIVYKLRKKDDISIFLNKRVPPQRCKDYKKKKKAKRRQNKNRR